MEKDELSKDQLNHILGGAPIKKAVESYNETMKSKTDNILDQLV